MAKISGALLVSCIFQTNKFGRVKKKIQPSRPMRLSKVEDERMKILKIGRYHARSAEMRAHAITRQAINRPRKPLTMKQSREISQKRHEAK